MLSSITSSSSQNESMEESEMSDVAEADTSLQALVHLDTIHETESEYGINSPEHTLSDRIVIPYTLYAQEDRLNANYLAGCEMDDLQISEATSIIQENFSKNVKMNIVTRDSSSVPSTPTPSEESPLLSMRAPRSKITKRELTIEDIKQIVEGGLQRGLTQDEATKILESNLFRTSTKLEIANVGMIYGQRSSSLLLRSYFQENLSEHADIVRFREQSYDPHDAMKRLRCGIIIQKLRYTGKKLAYVTMSVTSKFQHISLSKRQSKELINMRNIYGILFGPVSGTFQLHPHMIRDVWPWQWFSFVVADRTYDFIVQDTSDLADILIWISYLCFNWPQRRISWLPISKDQFMKLKIQMKIKATLEERGLSLNELFFLALFRTSYELDFPITLQEGLLKMIESRFTPQAQLFRTIRVIIDRKLYLKTKLKNTTGARRKLRDEIRKRILVNIRTERQKISVPMTKKINMRKMESTQLEDLKIMESILFYENVRRNKLFKCVHNLDDEDLDKQIYGLDIKHQNIIDDRNIIKRASTLSRSLAARRLTVNQQSINMISLLQEEDEAPLEFEQIVMPTVNNPDDFDLRDTSF